MEGNTDIYSHINEIAACIFEEHNSVISFLTKLHYKNLQNSKENMTHYTGLEDINSTLI